VNNKCGVDAEGYKACLADTTGEGLTGCEAGAYTRSLQSSTWGPSGHIALVRAQLEHLRDTSTG